jgi:hypothetical protein
MSEIFMENVRRFREYAASRGAYFDARGFLIYRGRVLTKADSEYLAESETAFERPLTDEEIEAAFDDLVFYARAYEEDEENE